MNFWHPDPCGGSFEGGFPLTEDNDAKAREIAHGPIQGFIGPDHRVIDMEEFYSALVQALRGAQRHRE